MYFDTHDRVKARTCGKNVGREQNVRESAGKSHAKVGIVNLGPEVSTEGLLKLGATQEFE